MDPKIRFEFVEVCRYGKYEPYKDICLGEATEPYHDFKLCKACRAHVVSLGD